VIGTVIHVSDDGSWAAPRQPRPEHLRQLPHLKRETGIVALVLAGRFEFDISDARSGKSISRSCGRGRPVPGKGSWPVGSFRRPSRSSSRRAGCPDRSIIVIPVIFYVLGDIGNRLSAVFSDHENER
jgi:hypothetical protein